LAQRQTYLEAQEKACVGIGPVVAIPPGYFNCHSVSMQLGGQALLAVAEVQDADRDNNKPAACIAAKKFFGILDTIREIMKHPDCRVMKDNPLLSPQLWADRDKAVEFVTQCLRTPWLFCQKNDRDRQHSPP
jgi:hypothetical protein